MEWFIVELAEFFRIPPWEIEEAPAHWINRLIQMYNIKRKHDEINRKK